MMSDFINALFDRIAIYINWNSTARKNYDRGFLLGRKHNLKTKTNKKERS